MRFAGTLEDANALAEVRAITQASSNENIPNFPMYLLTSVISIVLLLPFSLAFVASSIPE